MIEIMSFATYLYIYIYVYAHTLILFKKIITDYIKILKYNKIPESYLKKIFTGAPYSSASKHILTFD
jgi:hypothetical protein